MEKVFVLLLDRRIIVSVCFFTFLIFLVRFFFQIFVEFAKAGFIYRLENSIANKLFINIMNAPYIFHLNSNSSEFHRDIQSNIGFFSATAINNCRCWQTTFKI